jgi:tRNA nucleotidyltransferase/poly(A) polymerase
VSNSDLPEIANLIPYLNRWVAIVKGRVAGVGLTREQAYRAAKRMRPKEKSKLLFVDTKGQPLSIEQTWLNKHKVLQKVVDILRTQHIEAYLVGGAVRDLLLEREQIIDFDFAVPGDGLAAGRQVADILKTAFYPLDPERGTGRVIYQTGIASGPARIYLDFATFRGSTLEVDLADRDFTINAIALSLTTTPELIDPLQGRQHLASRLVQATSPTAFDHDPVRVLRAVRQAVQFGFSIETQTKQYLQQAAPQLTSVSPERRRDELIKLLNTPAPGQAVWLLHHLEVLPHLLPEVEAMVGVSQSPPHHLDVFGHTVTGLDIWADMAQADWVDMPTGLRAEVEQYMNEPLAGNLSQRALMPLALLLHDTGKPLSRSEEGVGDATRIRFFGHERESSRLARRVMRRLHFSSQASHFVEAIVAHHMRPLLLALEQKVSRRAIYRLFRATGGAKYQAGVATAIHALVDQRATYRPGLGQAEEKALLKVVRQLVVVYFEQRDQVIDPPPLLTGRDLIDTLGITEGHLIGLLLKRLKEAQAMGQITDKEAALAFIKSDLDFARYQASEL